MWESQNEKHQTKMTPLVSTAYLPPISYLALLVQHNGAVLEVEENFEKENVRLISLSSYSELIDEALSLNYISKDQISNLQKWLF